MSQTCHSAEAMKQRLRQRMRENEKRALSRLGLPLKGRATFSSQGQDAQTEIESKDISATGGYFVAEACPAVGERIELFLRWAPETDEQGLAMTARAVVVRVDRLAETTSGFAVAFEGTPSLFK